MVLIDSFIGSTPVAITGPKTPKVSKPFARALFERRVRAQEIDGGDVVHAGIAEDVIAGLGFRDVEAFLADDDTEFALVNDLSGIGGRTLDRPVGGPIGIRRLQEPQRLLRPLEIVLGREL